MPTTSAIIELEKDAFNKRKYCKGRITNIGNELARTELTQMQLTSLLDRLIDIFKKYEDHQMTLECINDVTHGPDGTTTENKYLNFVASIKQRLTSNVEVATAQIGDNTAGNISNPTGKPHLKLPEIKLPWTNFKDLFNSVITNNNQLSGVQRFSKGASNLP